MPPHSPFNNAILSCKVKEILIKEYNNSVSNFNDIYKKRSCEQFLNVGWQGVLPAYLWGKHGYIAIASDSCFSAIAPFRSPNSSVIHLPENGTYL